MKKRHITNHLKRKEWERKAMAKKGEQKTFETKKGDKYIFQHPGLREAVRMRDNAKNEHGVQQGEKLYDSMMEHVIFKEDGSKVNFEHFEEVGGFSEVMSEAVKFTFQES
ncbi:hypothetical protein [Psychrobacillus sp. FSL K6-2843]